MSNFIPTGNEYVSLSDISEQNGAILGFSFLYMGYKGLIEVRGDDNGIPLFLPYVNLGSENVNFNNLTWDLCNDWIPRYTFTVNNIEITGTILTPIGERGFIYHFSIKNCKNDKTELKIGLNGIWKKTLHEINESKEINCKKYAYESNWNHSVVFDMRREVSLFAFAPLLPTNTKTKYTVNEDDSISFDFSKTIALAFRETKEVDFFWGIGFEEVSASTSAKEMKRRGYLYELQKTQNWLNERAKHIESSKMCSILNRNMFFNFFYASGKTIDTEELVLVTSRSSRYYVSAAYWDRDSLLWSFPSILMADTDYAREILLYVYTKQIKNVGIHSRYIDGTVLEPGFELDELCAPIIALYKYVKETKNNDILINPNVENGVRRILKLLAQMKHNEIALYETFLQPTDDVIKYPYLTYDNVLVWYLFKNIEEMYQNIWSAQEILKLSNCANEVSDAIYKHCVKDYNDKQIFAWSVDLNGNWNIYDEPPGSLQLLPYYNFVSAEDEIYINTVEIIRDPSYEYSFVNCKFAEIGCAHAPHPWVLSIANSLLCGRLEQSENILSRSKLDNGIACESIDENTGECTTGEAFATCAGFLAYAIWEAFGK